MGLLVCFCSTAGGTLTLSTVCECGGSTPVGRHPLHSWATRGGTGDRTPRTACRGTGTTQHRTRLHKPGAGAHASALPHKGSRSVHTDLPIAGRRCDPWNREAATARAPGLPAGPHRSAAPLLRPGANPGLPKGSFTKAVAKLLHVHVCVPQDGKTACCHICVPEDARGIPWALSPAPLPPATFPDSSLPHGATLLLSIRVWGPRGL